MKSISILASLAAVSVVCLAMSCSSKSDGDDSSSAGSSSGGTSAGGTSAGGNNAGGTSAAGDGAGGDGTSGSNSTAGTSNTGASGAGNGEAGAGNGEAGAGPGSGANSCSTGVLFEGDPLYNDKAPADPPPPKAAGQGLLDDPPIRNEAIAVIGSKFFIETEKEIWMADMSVKTPVLARIAGDENSTFINAGVACKDTTFLVVRDMTATADGKLELIDFVGGAVIEITDPGGANCTSHYVAGTHAKTADPLNDYPLAQGDMDGPGAGALFGGDPKVTGVTGAGINHITVDPAGNIYTWDDGTGKYKKIATDAARTVSTIGQSSTDDNVIGLAFLNGKLYATGVDGSNDFMLEVDPSKYSAATPKANVKEVFRSATHFANDVQNDQAAISQVIADGDALLISTPKGFVWRVAPDGTVLATLAGSGPAIDYTPDFDPTISHPATAWELVNVASDSFGGPWLAKADGKLYWSGGIGIGKYIVQFSCP